MNFISQVKKDLDILKKIIPQESTKIESLLTNISADKLVNFLVVAEDHRYKYHIGFDVIAIFRAILKNIVYKTSNVEDFLGLYKQPSFDGCIYVLTLAFYRSYVFVL